MPQQRPQHAILLLPQAETNLAQRLQRRPQRHSNRKLTPMQAQGAQRASLQMQMWRPWLVSWLMSSKWQSQQKCSPSQAQNGQLKSFETSSGTRKAGLMWPLPNRETMRSKLVTMLGSQGTKLKESCTHAQINRGCTPPCMPMTSGPRAIAPTRSATLIQETGGHACDGHQSWLNPDRRTQAT